MSEFIFPHLAGLKDAYLRDGYAIVREVLDRPLVGELERHIDWLIDKHPDLPTETLGHWLIADDPFWVRFLSDERLLDVAQQIVGPNIALFAADYICKPPGKGRPLLWHQDAHYWPLVPMDVFTIWFAVSESGPHNGGVQMIPGSQKLGPLDHSSSVEGNNVLSSGADSSRFDERDAVDMVLQPGDISIHSPLTVHGSQPNRSSIWRKGGSIQYMPTTTLVTEDNWPSLFLFRGESVDGINEYRKKPKYLEGEHLPFEGCEAWA